MKTFKQIIAEISKQISELMPWELAERLSHSDILIVDVREPKEFHTMHIKNSINVPRGILEAACEWDYEETVPELAKARDREVVTVCRSGNRSALAAYMMQQLGFKKVYSLKTGLRGWNDYEQPLVTDQGIIIDQEIAEKFFTSKIKPVQRSL